MLVSKTFSIGFKFGEHAGHSTTPTFVCRKNAIVSLALYLVQKMVYVNKVIGCGNLERFDMHDLIMVFLSSHRHQKFWGHPRTIGDVNPHVTASSHWFVICFVPLTSANVIWYSHHGPTRRSAPLTETLAPNSLSSPGVSAPVGWAVVRVG